MERIDKLKVMGKRFMDASKAALQDKGRLPPVVVEVRGVYLRFLTVPQELTKKEGFEVVRLILAEDKADAAFVITDSYIKALKKEEAEKYFSEYSDGKMSEDYEAKECIVVALKGPDIKPYVMTSIYERDKYGDIVFKDEIQWVEAEMNVLRNWW